MIKVGVNGFGVIGRRVASAVRLQEDMQLLGVVKTRPDYKARLAHSRGVKIYVAEEKQVDAFQKAGIEVAGTVEELVKRVDVMVDATPDGVGEDNKSMYERNGKKAIFQGGEEADVGEVSFVAQCNYDSAVGKRFVRVVSCNTTALCRVLNALDKEYGVKRARVVIARRAADPEEVKKGPIDSVVLDPITIPSHHAGDVKTVLPHINITTMALKIPATHMHLHSVNVTLKTGTTTQNVIDTLSRTPRVMVVSSADGFKSTANLFEYARELGRPRADIYESVVWGDSVKAEDDEVSFFMAVHQEAIVVPENIDAIRAVYGGYRAEDSIRMTNRSLGIMR